MFGLQESRATGSFGVTCLARFFAFFPPTVDADVDGDEGEDGRGGGKAENLS